MRLAPPLPAIEAFLVTAQSDSLRDAARRLALSPSAVSRRIQTLETHLGCDLFERRKDGFALTPAGMDYLETIREPLDRLLKATDAARNRKSSHRIRFMASHSILAAWLGKRLIEFEAENSGLEVDLVVGHTASDFKRSGSDIGYLSDTLPLDGLDFEPCIEITAIAVSTPQLANGSSAPASLDEIRAAPRIVVKDPEDIWQTWWNGVGGSPALQGKARTYQTIMLSLEAATTGSGVALGVAPHATRYMKSGQLVRCTDKIFPLNRHYGIAAQRSETSATPALRRFRNWLGEESRKADQDFRQVL